MGTPVTSTITQTLPTISQSATAVHDLKTGSVAQTLPTLTQAVTGSSLEQLVTSSANVSSSAIFEYLEEVTSEVVANSETFSIIAEEVSSSVNASSEATYDVIIYATSQVNASSSLELAETTLISSTVKAQSEVEFSYTMALSSTIQASSTLELSRDITLESVAYIKDEVYPGVQANQIETSRANLSSYVFTGQFIELTSSATIASTVEHILEAIQTVESTGTASSSAESWAVSFEEVTSQALVTDQVSFEGSIYSETVTSVVHAKDWMWAKDFGAVAWVMNTETGGLSNYDNFGFTSLAFHNGKLYGTSPEGLFEMGADDDDGRDIDASIGRGFEDWGSDTTKRVSDIFVGHTGGELECDVETYDERVYTYPMAYQDSESPRNSRIKVGRGLSSRWWKLSLRNVGGADFQIQDIAVQQARSKRRL